MEQRRNMDFTIIAICDEDEIMRQKLSRYFISHTNVFVMVESLPPLLLLDRGDEVINLLICTEASYEQLSGNKTLPSVEKWLILKEENSKLCKSAANIYFCSRYDSARDLLRISEALLADNFQALKFDKENPEMALVTSGEAFVIGVASPIGRCGKTSLAYMLSEFASEKYRALFLCLDSGNVIFQSEEKGLSDLIYEMESREHLREKDKRIKYDQYIRKQGRIDYIPALSSYSDIFAVKPHIIKALIHDVGTLYDLIIIDVGSFLSSDDKFFGLCDDYLVPGTDDLLSKDKLACWMKVMEKNCPAVFPDKIQLVKTRPFSDSDSQKSYFESLRFSLFGKDIRSLWERYDKLLTERGFKIFG